MAEIIQKDGTWTFDGDTVRIVPGSDKGVGLLRKTLGELAVPLEAVAGVSLSTGRKSGRLRLRLRDGADPLIQITGGKLEDGSDPYQLTVGSDRTGVAEYFVDEVRNALLIEQIGTDPVDRYLLPGPSLPIAVSAGDGTAAFDGEQIKLSWSWTAEESKSSGGPSTIALRDVEEVEWAPSSGLGNGHLRFTISRSVGNAPPKYDPHAVELWGFRKDPLMALVAAAVVARMPHPYASTKAAAIEATPARPSKSLAGDTAPDGDNDHDALLRRLRELGELHQSGILTDDEFTTAKQAILRRL
ncbi:DUF4429 domain-containing protein [Streptomyces albipurpureus]|uniref:DUF4429 domain-containing protein n=1 Tax=Streptomyces albipurpureus TaxID=2897419 RepID=A0ABT0UXV8_9ACTN|nr:DUF4429 domain-containing protein [Streptomyces sp. CWNU-1]MCM2392168.1 DUF4429 domain-containing protein [Streptomyces sp. CWNU-1]